MFKFKFIFLAVLLVVLVLVSAASSTVKPGCTADVPPPEIKIEYEIAYGMSEGAAVISEKASDNKTFYTLKLRDGFSVGTFYFPQAWDELEPVITFPPGFAYQLMEPEENNTGILTIIALYKMHRAGQESSLPRVPVITETIEFGGGFSPDALTVQPTHGYTVSGQIIISGVIFITMTDVLTSSAFLPLVLRN